MCLLEKLSHGTHCKNKDNQFKGSDFTVKLEGTDDSSIPSLEDIDTYAETDSEDKMEVESELHYNSDSFVNNAVETTESKVGNDEHHSHTRSNVMAEIQEESFALAARRNHALVKKCRR